jgi:hypothetical protein
VVSPNKFDAFSRGLSGFLWWAANIFEKFADGFRGSLRQIVFSARVKLDVFFVNDHRRFLVGLRELLGN